MLATIINVFSIIVGSLIGLFFNKFINKAVYENLMKAIGIVILVIGLVGILKAMLSIENDIVTTNYELIYLIMIVVGVVIGESLKLDERLNRINERIENTFKQSAFSTGFINASMLYSVGAMAIVGSIEAAQGRYEILLLKSALDGITSIILASTLGIGVLFSALTVLFYQGSITIASSLFNNVTLNNDFNNVFGMVGYTLVFCLGINFIVKDKLKVINMLPSLLLVIIYYLIIWRV